MLKLRPTIFPDLLLARAESFGRFPVPLCFPSSSEPAYRYFLFSLTFDHAGIYHP